MMLEKNNQVMNVGQTEFIKLVLDLFKLFTFQKLHKAITTLIEQMWRQETFVNTH
jgi:hypothetical protein